MSRRLNSAAIIELLYPRFTPVAKALQKRRIPFALVSGFGRPNTPDPVLDEVPCLLKPTTATMLLAMLEKLCNSSQV